MSYQEALEKAGAEVLLFKYFGSYQGDWFALVSYGGQTGWVNGSYGSCSGCDAFQAEFSYMDEWCDEHTYDRQRDCKDCIIKAAEYEVKLVEFGRGYLETIMDQKTAETYASKDAEWSHEDGEMLNWLIENRGKV